MFLRHPILSAVTLGYLALVGWVTLSPQSSLQRGSLLWRILELLEPVPGTQWLTFSRLEFLANIAMFVPIGLFLVLLLGRSRWWLAILLAVALTFAIEAAQQFVVGRVSDPRDLLANSLGAIIGTVIALAVTRVHSPTHSPLDTVAVRDGA
ncbi:MAG: VanZ family protein [Rhodoglobus sp.]